MHLHGWRALTFTIHMPKFHPKMPNAYAAANGNKQPPKPEGWSKSSSAPYYNEKFGTMLRPFLDKIAEDNEQVAFFDCPKLRMSVAACYARIYQGWRWLIDNVDKDGKYVLLKASCQIDRGRNAVTIRFGKTGRLKMLEGETMKQNKGWREQLVEYTEDAPDNSEPLEVKAIPFTEEDLDWLGTYLGAVDDIVATIRITTTSFKVCKNALLAQKIKEKRIADGIKQ